MRIRTGLLFLPAVVPLLVGCEMLDRTPPEPHPSAIAEKYVGKPLLQLEMRWSTPESLNGSGAVQAATWSFDQFNYSGCTVTVHTDASGIIRKVAWTVGCGPKGTGGPAPAAFDSP
jgi:hypothetical protein